VKRYNQFILYQLVPSTTRPGKADKLPTDWQTGQVANAHDPAIWTDHYTATVAAKLFGTGYGVGFVFTENDPLWFLDIDNCRDAAGNWSQLALDLIARLPGALVEVSISGKGLHIIGSGKVPSHACKNTTLGLEFYHTGRFVALGYTDQATGDSAIDLTAEVAGIIADYFPTSVSSEAVDTDWTDAPVVPQYGITDDDELIRAACASSSAASTFGNRARFVELFDADQTALSAAFPDGYGNRAYDASSADAALVKHLAWWSGGNCEQMRRIMLRSALKRDKWEREDYVRRTILSATRTQDTWYERRVADAEPEPAAVPSDHVTHSLSTGRWVQGSVFLNADDQIKKFAGHVYIRDMRRIMAPNGTCYSKETFDDWHAGYKYVLDDQGKTTDSAWQAFVGSQLYRFPKVDSGAFRPTLPHGAIWTEGEREYVNTYYPVKTACKAGDISPFADYMRRAFPVQRDSDILLAYAAALVQYPGVKFQWCPLIQGTHGNGKSFFSECVIEAIGREYWFSPKASELTGKFNDWIYRRLLITVEDIYVPSHKADVIEALKPMITGSYLEIEGKGSDRVTREICANFILNSNHKDAIRKTRDDRRFAIFYSGQQSVDDIARDGMDGDYFPDLYAWARAGGYAIINEYLRSYQIPDELNPATRCHRAPRTSSTEEAITASRSPVEQEIEHACDQERPGFKGGWISTHYLDVLLKELNVTIARNKRRDLLTGMGYCVHPGLASTDGRVNNPVMPDGPTVKPRLYVRCGHSTSQMQGIEAVRAYEEAQRGAAVAPPASVLAFNARA